eukprot:1993611-Amphidinium_carterae.1
MTEATWSCFERCAGASKVLAKKRRQIMRAMFAAAFYCWREVIGRQRGQSWLGDLWQQHYQSYLVAKMLHRRCRQYVRNRCRKDKAAWLEAQCETLRQTYMENPNRHHALLRNLMKWRPRPRPKYAVSGKQYAQTMDQLCDAWDAHWREKLYAVVTPTPQTSFSFESYLPTGFRTGVAEEIVVEPFTQGEVSAALKQMDFSKSSIDLIHAEVMGSLRKEVTPLLTSLYNEVLLTGAIPACWKGA